MTGPYITFVRSVPPLYGLRVDQGRRTARSNTGLSLYNKLDVKGDRLHHL